MNSLFAKLNLDSGKTVLVVGELSLRVGTGVDRCLGDIKVIQMEQGHMQFYQANMLAHEVLNESFDWNEDYLREIRTSLVKQSLQYKYLLQTNQENSTQVTLKVFRKLDKNKNDRILFFKVALEQVQCHNPIQKVYDCFLPPFQAQSEAIRRLSADHQALQTQHTQLLHQMHLMQEQHRTREQLTLDKFVNILNAKKEKLRQLRAQVKGEFPGEQQLYYVEDQQVDYDHSQNMFQLSQVQFTQFQNTQDYRFKPPPQEKPSRKPRQNTKTRQQQKQKQQEKEKEKDKEKEEEEERKEQEEIEEQKNEKMEEEEEGGGQKGDDSFEELF